MQSPQTLFTEILDLKKQLKTVLAPYKEALQADPQYAQWSDEVKELNRNKKQVADKFKDDFASEWAQADEIKESIKLKQEIITAHILGDISRGHALTDLEFEDEEKKKKYQPSLGLIFKPL